MKTHARILALIFLFGWSTAHAQGQLENPPDGGKASGVGLVSGWHCDASSLEIVIDDKPARPAAYGTRRGDTSSVCGDVENGFGLLVNYNLLGDGEHTIRALADGVEFGSSTFTVTTLGQSFISGKSASFIVYDFPEEGNIAIAEWQESSQNFVIGEFSNDANAVNLAETLRLAGTWEFVHQGTGDQTRIYYLPAANVVPRPGVDGDYNINGNDEEDENNVIAGYLSADGVWLLQDPGTSVERVFIFTFNEANRVTGCYYERPNDSSNFSNCFAMEGNRSNTQTP